MLSIVSKMMDAFLDEEIDLILEDQEGNVYIDANAWSVPEVGRHVVLEYLYLTA